MGSPRTWTRPLLAAGLAFLVFAPSAGFLYVGVIIAGFAMGADIPVSLALIAEESAPEDRGRMVAFSQVMWIGGIASSTILGFAVSTLGPLGARILFAHVLVVAIVVWVLRRALPESRQWNEAVAVASGSSRTDALGVDRRVGVVSTRQHKGKIKDLAPFLAPLIATALFYTFNNLSANTLGQFSTYLFTNVAGVSVTAATVVGLVGLPIGLGSNFLFMRIVGGRFRTPAFVIGTASLVAGFCVPLVGGFSYGTLFAASLLAGFGGGLAGEAIYKVWSQELFPTLVRSSAQGSTIFVTRALTAAFAFVTPVIAQADPRMLMGILVALNLAAGIVGFFWVRRLPKAVDVSATERAVAV